MTTIDATDTVRRAGWVLGALTLSVAAGTDTGRRYPANYDVYALSAQPPALVVADGMGDGRGSAMAGTTAVKVLLDELAAAARPGGPGVDAVTLRTAVAQVQRRVRAVGARLAELTGCTLTAMLPATDGSAQAWLVQLGDSRAYRLRDGLLELLTVDHTAAWLGAVYGWYPADSPQAGAARYHLHRYVGHPQSPEPDLLNVGLRPGDVYCLCTDGVAEQVSYQRLAQVLGGGADPADQVALLLADASAAGGRDNATVVVARVGAAAT